MIGFCQRYHSIDTINNTLFKQHAVDPARSRRKNIFNVAGQAFGTHVDPAKSHNLAVRKVITTVKKVVEHVNKSPRAKVNFFLPCVDVVMYSVLRLVTRCQ